MSFGSPQPPIKPQSPIKPQPPSKSDAYGSQGPWSEASHEKTYVKYVPVGYAQTHNLMVGYLLWFVGFLGAHRFYYGKPVSGVIWFFTFGLLGVGWFVDLFLMPSMTREANSRFVPGQHDFGVTWLFLIFAGLFGVHRLYMGKIGTGILYFLTFGLCGVGIIYDVLTLNDQVGEQNDLAAARLGSVQYV